MAHMAMVIFQKDSRRLVLYPAVELVMVNHLGIVGSDKLILRRKLEYQGPPERIQRQIIYILNRRNQTL